MDAVRADDEVVAPLRAVGEPYGCACAVLLERLHGDAELHACAERAGELGKNAVQNGSQDATGARDPGIQRRALHFLDRPAMHGAHADAFVRMPFVHHALEDAEHLEGAQRRGGDGDAGARHLPARVLLGEIDLEAEPTQHDGARHPGDAAAHHQRALRRRHQASAQLPSAMPVYQS